MSQLPGPMLRGTEARGTIKSTHRRSIWESNLSVLCLSSSSSSVRSWIRSSGFWEYLFSIHSIESATLVFLPWLMLLNWKWNENPNLSMKISIALGPQVENLGHGNEPDIVPARKSWMVGSRYVNRQGVAALTRESRDSRVEEWVSTLWGRQAWGGLCKGTHAQHCIIISKHFGPYKNTVE